MFPLSDKLDTAACPKIRNKIEQTQKNYKTAPKPHAVALWDSV